MSVTAEIHVVDVRIFNDVRRIQRSVDPPTNHLLDAVMAFELVHELGIDKLVGTDDEDPVGSELPSRFQKHAFLESDLPNWQ